MGKRDSSVSSSISGMLNDAFQCSSIQLNSWKNSLSDIIFPASTSGSSLTVTKSPAVLFGGAIVVAASAISIRSIWKMYSTRHLLRDNKTNEYAPGPKPVPLLGNMVSLKAAYYETLYEYVDKPVSVFWIMSTPFVVVNDKDGLRKVLGSAGGLYTKPKYFGYRSKAVKDAMQAKKDQVAEESIEYQPNGDASRKGLERMIVSSFDRIKFSMENLLTDLALASEEEESGKLAEAGKYIRKAIVGLNLEVLFGLRQGNDCKEDAGRIADMIDHSGTEFARRMVNPLKVWIDLPSNIRFFRDVGGLIQLGRRLCSVLDEAAKSFLQNVTDAASAIAKDASGLSWVHAWIGKVGKIGKLGKVVGLLMASTQTVPLTAVWMLHLIANNGIIRKRLQMELKNQGINSGSELTYEHMTKLPLADAVVRETLRLYPPFPLIQRQAQEDDVLCGVRIAKGTIVYVVPWLIHRNSKYWSRAHEFCPERFLDDWQGDDSSDWIFVPFGRGARMCAGSKLAMTELKVLLCNAVLDYKWTSEQTATNDERFPALGMNPRGVQMWFEKVIG